MKLTTDELRKMIKESLNESNFIPSDILTPNDIKILNNVKSLNRLNVKGVIESARLGAKGRYFGPNLIKIEQEGNTIRIGVDLSHLDKLNLVKKDRPKIEQSLGKNIISYDIDSNSWSENGVKLKDTQEAKAAVRNLVPTSLRLSQEYADSPLTIKMR